MMQRSLYVQKLTTSALLIALGIVIPMFSPAKIIIEPASFTLASHVPVFIAMFISPWAAVAVAIGTTLGFLLGPFPFVVVLRAASHVVFAGIGSYWLSQKPNSLQTARKSQGFSFIIGLLHAICELTVVSIFYFGGNMASSYYNSGFLSSVLLLVGVGTLAHSMVDLTLAQTLIRAISRQKGAKQLFSLYAK